MSFSNFFLLPFLPFFCTKTTKWTICGGSLLLLLFFFEMTDGVRRTVILRLILMFIFVCLVGALAVHHYEYPRVEQQIQDYEDAMAKLDEHGVCWMHYFVENFLLLFSQQSCFEKKLFVSVCKWKKHYAWTWCMIFV